MAEDRPNGLLKLKNQRANSPLSGVESFLYAMFPYLYPQKIQPDDARLRTYQTTNFIRKLVGNTKANGSPLTDWTCHGSQPNRPGTLFLSRKLNDFMEIKLKTFLPVWKPQRLTGMVAEIILENCGSLIKKAKLYLVLWRALFEEICQPQLAALILSLMFDLSSELGISQSSLNLFEHFGEPISDRIQTSYVTGIQYSNFDFNNDEEVRQACYEIVKLIALRCGRSSLFMNKIDFINLFESNNFDAIASNVGSQIWEECDTEAVKGRDGHNRRMVHRIDAHHLAKVTSQTGENIEVSNRNGETTGNFINEEYAEGSVTSSGDGNETEADESGAEQVDDGDEEPTGNFINEEYAESSVTSSGNGNETEADESGAEQVDDGDEEPTGDFINEEYAESSVTLSGNGNETEANESGAELVDDGDGESEANCAKSVCRKEDTFNSSAEANDNNNDKENFAELTGDNAKDVVNPQAIIQGTAVLEESPRKEALTKLGKKRTTSDNQTTNVKKKKEENITNRLSRCGVSFAEDKSAFAKGTPVLCYDPKYTINSVEESGWWTAKFVAEQRGKPKVKFPGYGTAKVQNPTAVVLDLQKEQL